MVFVPLTNFWIPKTVAALLNATYISFAVEGTTNKSVFTYVEPVLSWPPYVKCVKSDKSGKLNAVKSELKRKK